MICSRVVFHAWRKFRTVSRAARASGSETFRFCPLESPVSFSQSITSCHDCRNSMSGPGGGTSVLAKSMAGSATIKKKSGRLEMVSKDVKAMRNHNLSNNDLKSYYFCGYSVTD